MSEKYQSADLILKLYEMRRDPVMREARTWFVSQCNPNSAMELAAMLRGPHSAYYRMVTSYWDMACSFVTNGAIDAQMFIEANSEHNAVFCKVAPYVAELREMSQMPNYLKHLEEVVMSQPNAAERLEHLRALLQRMFADNVPAEAKAANE